MSFGTVNPWKCRIVGWVISLRRMIRTWSPGLTRISGPGTVPLKPIASTNTPGLVSHRISSAVSSKTLTPFSVAGSSGLLPWESVSAGKASTLSRWPSSISLTLIPACAPLAPEAPLVPAATTAPA